MKINLLLVISLVLFTECIAYLSKPISTQHSKVVMHATGSLGSDLIERPDDEDSPEFKEYLRMLLKMQMNRAKTGFAAPSS